MAIPAIGVRFDRVYGKVVCYPVSTQAQLLAEIAGTKTLLPKTLSLAQQMGMTVSITPADKAMLENFVKGG